ncbi:MAG: ABC transporter permease [Planctomycetota bacterium]
MPELTAAPNDSPTLRALALAWRRSWFRVGCYTLSVFVLAAVYAPFIATEAALWQSGPDGWSSPAILDLFNRRSYPKYHDLLFNLLTILLPAFVIFWLVTRRRFQPGQRLCCCLGTLVVAMALAMTPLFPRATGGGWQALWDDRPTTSYTIVDERLHAEAPGTRIFSPVPHRWDATYPGATFKEPGWENPTTGAHCLLGTDPSGHDVLARMLFGARISLTIGIVATGIAMAIGTIIGAIAGFMGGRIDLLLQRLVEIMMCFPTFILILTVVAMTKRDIFIIMMVIGLTGWAGTARLVRGEFLSQSVRDYVSAARSLGLPPWRIMFLHILPNAIAPLLISATFGIAGAILGESGLSFIGLGDPNAASWGQLLNHGRENPTFAWLIYVPGLTIFILVIALNTVGEGLRQALDPKAN